MSEGAVTMPLTQIHHAGQKYLDEPIILKPVRTPLQRSLDRAFGNPSPQPVVVGYERVQLRWMNPDGSPKFPET